jgi:hypothetical protein
MPLSTNTRWSVTIGALFTCGAFLVTVTWNAANTLRDIKGELSEIRTQMQSQVSELSREVAAQERRAWNKYDMGTWASQLERANRSKGLEVPDPREIRP